MGFWEKRRKLEKGHCLGDACVARKLAQGAAQSPLRRRAEQMAATAVKCCRSVPVGIVVLSTYRQTSRCLLQKSASLQTEGRKGRLMWTPSSRSHGASSSAWRGAPERGCTMGCSSGKHRSGLSPRLTVATAPVPTQHAGPRDTTQSWKGGGWKGPRGSIWSNPAAQAGLHRASRPGRRINGF